MKKPATKASVGEKIAAAEYLTYQNGRSVGDTTHYIAFGRGGFRFRVGFGRQAEKCAADAVKELRKLLAARIRRALTAAEKRGRVGEREAIRIEATRYLNNCGRATLTVTDVRFMLNKVTAPQKKGTR